MMLAPDLLDRRALACLALRDAFGRPVTSPVQVTGDGVKLLAKDNGTIAVLEAPGFAEYTRSFTTPPASPAVGSKSISLLIRPAESRVQAREFVLKLPRDPDPAKFDQPDSLFHRVEVQLLATPLQRPDPLACILRVRVRRKSDKALVGGALVRAKSNNGKFEAMGVTDRAGEAALVFPDLPLGFSGAGGAAVPELPAKTVVKVVQASATFTKPEDLAAPDGSVSRDAGPFDPDKLASGAAPNFAGGEPFKLAVGTQPTLELEWKQP